MSASAVISYASLTIVPIEELCSRVSTFEETVTLKASMTGDMNLAANDTII